MLNMADDYPFLPGFKKAGTSADAAKALAPVTGNIRNAVYLELLRAPGTADEIAARLDLSILAVRPRLTELMKLGRIEESGERRANKSGKKATVWRAL